MRMTDTFNGWSSWNAWNLNLWMTNDKQTYDEVMEHLESGDPHKATQSYMDYLLGSRIKSTPDGGVYNYRDILEVMEGLLDR